MTYGNEGVYSTTMVVEPMDEYHGNENRDHAIDKNEGNFGGNKFEDYRNNNYVGGRSRCSG